VSFDEYCVLIVDDASHVTRVKVSQFLVCF